MLVRNFLATCIFCLASAVAASEKAVEKQPAEVARIDAAAKAAGFVGFADMSIPRMIHTTQKEGGLERFVNKVVGCTSKTMESCKRWYRKIQAMQIMEDGVLYSFYEFGAGNEPLEFVIYVPREPGKLYQNGQSLENTLYAFRGVVEYETVSGGVNAVPVFTKANLKLD